MTLHLGTVPAGITLYIPFAAYDSNGASVTLTGLAVTDIEIYKDGSVTQRASDAGYALLDTDGIDFDGITGIHGFSIDTSDNTDAGFYSVGGQFWVVVSAVTIDSQTVNFIAATFRLGPAEASAGVPDVNVASMDNGTITSNVFAAACITATAIATDAIGSNELAASAVAEIADAVWDEAQSGHVGTGTFGEIATEIAAILVDTGTTLDGKLDTIDGNVDAILLDTAEIGAAGAGLTVLATQASVDALNDISAADVNAQVLDVLNTDTFAEPTGVPPATTTALTKLGYLYMALRNQITITATKKTFYDDAGAAEWEKDLSDDGTTYTETEGNAI